MIKAFLYNLWLNTKFDFYADMEKYRRWIFLDKYEENVPTKNEIKSQLEHKVWSPEQKADRQVQKEGFHMDGPSLGQSQHDMYLDKIYRRIATHHGQFKNRKITILEMNDLKIVFTISGLPKRYSFKKTEIATW